MCTHTLSCFGFGLKIGCDNNHIGKRDLQRERERERERVCRTAAGGHGGGDGWEDSAVPGAAVTAERCGPGGSDGRADGVIPVCGGDGDVSGSGRGRGGLVPGVALKAEEEQDGYDSEGGAGQRRWRRSRTAMTTMAED
jgi:hypothetical protein